MEKYMQGVQQDLEAQRDMGVRISDAAMQAAQHESKLRDYFENGCSISDAADLLRAIYDGECDKCGNDHDGPICPEQY